MRCAMAFVISVALGCGPTPPGAVDGGPGGGGGDGFIDANLGGGGAEFIDAGFVASCKRVDLVIAVDNSESMLAEIAAFRTQVWPQMAMRLENIGGGLDDYRVAVLDACPSPATFHTRGKTGPCNFSSGATWMESMSPDLVGEFQCVGDIDDTDRLCDGFEDDEQAAVSAAAATEATPAFLRDDALLVVVTITDEDEYPYPFQTVAQMHDRLVALKGDPDRMVFLGIGGSTLCDSPYDLDFIAEAVTLKQLAASFGDRGIFWDFCAGALENGLSEAMMLIDQACEEFPPIP